MSTKQQRKAFRRQAEAIIRQHGGQPGNGQGHWLLETRYGPMSLHIDDYENRRWIGTVFTRFDDVALVRDAPVDCNPYSGKWNHHYPESGWTLEQAIDNLTFNLEKVCAPAVRWRKIGGKLYQVPT